MNPFDFWEGANFKLKIRNVEGYRNYDKSEFDSPSPLSEDDSVIESVWSKQYSLLPLVDPNDPKLFKSYDFLKDKLQKVLAGNTVATPRAEDISLDNDPIEETTRVAKTQVVSVPKPAPKKEVDFDDDDEALSYFSKLAAGE